MTMQTSLLDRHDAAAPARAPLAIIDDEPDITCALAAWARLNDIEPVVYHRGEALFQGLCAHDGQLCWLAPNGTMRQLGGAVIDVGLPGLSGFEVAHALRRLAPELPMVIMTAMNATESALEGTPPPGVVVLQKPFDLDALEDCLVAVRAGTVRGPAGA
jgi:DNA-binding response OmpR family regulator